MTRVYRMTEESRAKRARQMSEKMNAYHADPNNRRAASERAKAQWAASEKKPIALLSADQRRRYNTLRRYGLDRETALHEAQNYPIKDAAE